jgi:hypothetical protein
MDEVKGMAGIMGQSKRDVMTYFKDFIEDYNTATMPHEKYYNYEFWEMNEYKKAQLNKINKTGVLKEYFNDEEERFAEMKKQKIKAEQKEFADTKARLASNKLKMENMARQVCIILLLEPFINIYRHVKLNLHILTVFNFIYTEYDEF